jgi:hypothetical protein
MKKKRNENRINIQVGEGVRGHQYVLEVYIIRRITHERGDTVIYR